MQLSQKMEALYVTIHAAYLEQLGDLTFNDKYHLLHHLYLWSHDKDAHDELVKIKPIFSNDAWFIKNTANIFASPATLAVKNAASLRRPILEKHPVIRPLNSLLLEVLYAKTVFDLHYQSTIKDRISDEQIRYSVRQLLSEPYDVAVLSTYAINTLYLLDRFYFCEERLDPIEILAHAELLNLEVAEELLLYFYFITHCVIGETLFYSRPLPRQYREIYVNAIRRLDEILMTQCYDDLHMDIKFEVLVCARICDITLLAEAKIYQEALLSLAPSKNFIIDRHSKNAQRDYATLSSSEHRNVLFLMSCKPFEP